MGGNHFLDFPPTFRFPPHPKSDVGMFPPIILNLHDFGGETTLPKLRSPPKMGENNCKKWCFGGNEVFLEGKFSKSVPPKSWGKLASNRAKLWEGNIKISPSYGGEVPPHVPPHFILKSADMGGNKKSFPPHMGGNVLPWSERKCECRM